jgi:hypothetical protein
MISMQASAKISYCGKYRYQLTRPPLPGRRVELPTAVWVMLNPSTADAEQDDPTIRRCRDFAARWGCNGIVVLNLYAYRATRPADLPRTALAIGALNDFYLSNYAVQRPDFVCAWGAKADRARAAEVCAILTKQGGRLFCLGVNKDGSPKHPLYVKADTSLVPYVP